MSKTPILFDETKIIAILKPGNEGTNCRLITLLSTCYKLLKRDNKIKSILEEFIALKQTSLRRKRSCSDQMLTLTTYIESGYQIKFRSLSMPTTLCFQSDEFCATERRLEGNLSKLNEFFVTWRLKLNITKTRKAFF